jgi:AmmeMemoRadiSam system protein B
MSPRECPQLRPHLDVMLDDDSGRRFVLFDQLRLSEQVMCMGRRELAWLGLFNGRRTIRQIQMEVVRTTGEVVPLEVFTRLVKQLDEVLFLESERFRQHVRELAHKPIRSPSCLGSYQEDPEALRRQLRKLFTNGAGLPSEPRPDSRLRAVLAPHIDYGRGGLTYTYAFKELYERCEASLFVIIGTSHYSGHRFTLTRKHFQTPLGIAQTDGKYIDSLVAHYGDGLFDDPLAHEPEHSIELEVVFLQYLYQKIRDIRIVPLVVGSFADCVASGESPMEQPDIKRMVEALRAVERETAEPICYVISGDLAHVGPKFGDPEPVAPDQLAHSRTQDQAIMARAEKADPAGYFRVIRDEGDDRRICGLPPTWLVLEASQPKSGRMVAYDQYVHPEGYESVSFASAVFDR